MAKVLSIVSYHFLPPKMGGQKCIAQFYRFLSKKVDFECVTTQNNTPTAEDIYPIHKILANNSSRYINLFYFFSLKKIIKENKITHLMLEHPYYGWLGLLLKIFTPVKLIIHSHNIESSRFKSIGKWWWRILYSYEKITHKNADLNFFITDEDKSFAINHFKLNAAKCHTITYGFDLDNPPSIDEKSRAKNIICKLYDVPEDNTILFFNGTLDYKPNLDGVNHIINTINPILLNNINFKYTIIICGKNLPLSYNNLDQYPNVVYAGFVDDISLYFKAADIFINPVTDGGGIKTKLVEALGNDITSISTHQGAIGIPERITKNKLIKIKDNDWIGFTEAIFAFKKSNNHISQEFYTYFYWDNIAKIAAEAIEST